MENKMKSSLSFFEGTKPSKIKPKSFTGTNGPVTDITDQYKNIGPIKLKPKKLQFSIIKPNKTPNGSFGNDKSFKILVKQISKVLNTK